MERAMLNIAKYMSNQGASVDFLVASKKGPLLAEVTNEIKLIDLGRLRKNRSCIRLWLLKSIFLVDPFFVFLLFSKLPKSVKVIPELANYIRQNSPDVIISTPTTTNLAVLWSTHCVGFNKKVVIREATTLSQEIKHNHSLFFKFVKKFVEKWYNQASVVACVSNGVSIDLQKNFGVEKNLLKVVPNILDINRIQEKSEEYNSDIDEYKPYVLSMGRLVKSKNFQLLIKAFKLIANKVNYNLVILGEGVERKRLEALISDLSLSDRVFMPGFNINPYPFIRQCEIFALSSEWEGSPNVLCEALIFNKKIISTDCEFGPREILQNGKYGKLICVDDTNLFSEQLYDLIQEPGGKAGLSAVVSDQEISKQFYSIHNLAAK